MFSDQIHLIRYEDLSIDPFGTSDDLFKFLDLSPNKATEKFIKKHTQASRNLTLSERSNKIDNNLRPEKLTQDKAILYGPYGTFRNSRSTVFSWKKNMKSKDILHVQHVCRKPMKMLGYNPMINVAKNRDDDNFPLIVKSTQDVWSTEL